MGKSAAAKQRLEGLFNEGQTKPTPLQSMRT
jgi:hypothetical protein